jgi:hypothetical protein
VLRSYTPCIAPLLPLYTTDYTIGYIFPALVAGLVPLRAYIIPRLFRQEDLQYLDPFGETEQDYIQEQKEMLHALQRQPSLDEAELFHGISEFRAAQVAHDAQEFDILRHATNESGDIGGDMLLVSNVDSANRLRQRRPTTTNAINLVAGEHQQEHDPEEGGLEVVENN